MKNPFRFFKSRSTDNTIKDRPAVTQEDDASIAANTDNATALSTSEGDASAVRQDEPEDRFVEWCRSRTRGGIERIERNNIYEMYSVYGSDDAGRLICRCYHRYPEHERDFALSYSRVLKFDEFNARLLTELDKGGMSLADYDECIKRAEQTADIKPHEGDCRAFDGQDIAALRDFCELLTNIKDKSYRYSEGIYRCAGESIVGDCALNIWYRRLLPHDALRADTAGMTKTPIEAYDIEDIWIMGLCNRLRENGAVCRILRLQSEWSVTQQVVYLIEAEGIPSVKGTVLIAVAAAENFPRFGFYALDFSNK